MCVRVCVYVCKYGVRCEIMEYNVRRREKMSGGMSVGGIKLCTKSNQLINRQSQSISPSVSPSVLLIMKTKTRAGAVAVANWEWK